MMICDLFKTLEPAMPSTALRRIIFGMTLATVIAAHVLLAPVMALAWQADPSSASTVASSAPIAGSPQTRIATDPAELRRWLESMVWYHGYDREEIMQVTGLSPAALDAALREFAITPDNAPLPEVDPPVFVLPYPGGRHPRIGFLEGAIEPQRETKLSIFAPWDRSSYVVLDVPEAIWSNLGLTYLAHTHIDTIWSKQGIILEQLEWERLNDGSYRLTRELPNKILWRVRATPHRDHLAIRMSLTNGTAETLSDLRVQMCAMLRAMPGFDQQTNDNKLFRGSLAACRNGAGDRWVILGFEPNHRTWGNQACPCLHSDPIFPDCPAGQTRHVDGRLSFYQGTDIDGELERIERSWRPLVQQEVLGRVVDAESGEPMACRLYVRGSTGQWYFAEPATEQGQVIRYEKQNWLNAQSQEFHSSLSADPFHLRLPPGSYTLTAECGKEYLPWQRELVVAAGEEQQPLEIRLQRWIDMAAEGWYSGDMHVHRPISQIGIPMLADDVNVAFPMVYWTTRDDLSPEQGNRTNRDDAAHAAELIAIDPTHVIWPKNTEWEIFSVKGQPHTLGALFALNHQTPFTVGIPPVRQVLDQAEREGALLDMDKHDWPFAMLLPPILGERLLFELANNHMWRTEFAFDKWSTPAANWMTHGDEAGGSERGWIEYTHRTYWSLLNCGYRLQPTAGTATGVHPVPIGFGRVYVHVPGGFDYGRWLHGLRQGHSFVTTGPMLRAERNGDQVTVTIDAAGPIDSVEWIVNGRIEEMQPDAPTRHAHAGGSIRLEFTRPVSFAETSWVAVRVWQRTGEDRWRFAHSAPIWFDVPGSKIKPSTEEQLFLIRRMENELARSRQVLSAETLEEYHQALDAYRVLEPR